jgi:3-ketosteroid 9alpha-monooxygenase subunit B
MTDPTVQRARVLEVVQETADAHSLVLEPVGTDGPWSYRPGQFLTIRVPSEREGGAARCYSLSSSPHTGEPAKVTVKRTANGFGSNWLCDNVVAGDELDVLRPAGTFTPGALDGDLLLLAAGSGITPVMSILKSSLHAGTGSVVLLYANRDERSVIFAAELRGLTAAHPGRLTVVHWLETVQGVPDAAAWRSLLLPHLTREAFICGPARFMDLTVAALADLGVDPARIHVERFSSLVGDPFRQVELDTSGPTSTVEVELDGERRTVAWPQRSTLLDVLLADGLDAPFSCREGSCSACACVLLEGEVTMATNEVLDDRDLADGLILACQARPLSARLAITYEG